MNVKTILGKTLNDFLYRFVSGLWVVTPYYNPIGYRTRRKNYELFAQILRQSGIPLLTIECAFGEQPFDLPESVDVIRMRSNSMLWQKERLLNLAISWLPASCRYVAWLDCDLIFSNPNWAQETVELLQSAQLVQVFKTCNRLSENYSHPGTEAGNTCTSFTYICGQNPSVLQSGKFEDHGHTGYGWAARRELLDRHGLYEYAIAGSADHYMAHAALGDIDSPCIERMMLGRPALIEHFREWASPFYESAQGRIATVSGEVLHLWHGNLENRKYFLRQLELSKLDFNPHTDLLAIPGKPLELRTDLNKPGLREWFASYFASRQEDGIVAAA
jgi:hypothetical protein